MNILSEPRNFVIFFIFFIVFVYPFLTSKKDKTSLLSLTNEDFRVKKFGIKIHIPDLPYNTYEGGFYLYFVSPELKIQDIIANNFDKNTTIDKKFNIQEQRISFSEFKEALNNSYVYSNSHNVFNANKIEVYGILDNNKQFHGEKSISTENRMHLSNPIYFDNINLVI